MAGAAGGGEQWGGARAAAWGASTADANLSGSDAGSVDAAGAALAPPRGWAGASGAAAGSGGGAL